MSKYEELEVVITDFGVNGEGIGKCGELVVFVDGAVPGDVVLARITNLKKSYAFGVPTKYIMRSESRREPECASFGVCGGCCYLHVNYETELRFKKKKVNDAIRRIGGLNFEIDEIIGMENPSRYRNKAVYHVSAGKHKIGFYGAKSNEIVPVDECVIFDTDNFKIISAFKSYMKESGVLPYDEKTGRGSIRAIMIRKSFYTGDFLVCISSAKGSIPNVAGLVYNMSQCGAPVKGITLCVSKGGASSDFEGDMRFVWGDGFIIEKISGYSFKVSSGSFFQVNPVMTPLLYEKAREYAQLSKDDILLDAYAGTGTIAITLSKLCLEVIGAEINRNAVLDAEENAELNGASNTRFLHGDACETIKGLTEDAVNIDTVILDPPRSGCGKNVMEALGALSPKKIVYISCDPATLARDLRIASQMGYAIKNGMCFDMFPRCAHVETVLLLTKE